MDFLVENSRYSGPATFLGFYSNEFLVVCPKCQKDALITDYNYRFRHGGKLHCGSCHHTEYAASRIRYTLLVNLKCANCGQQISETIPNTKHKTTSIAITCVHCRAQCKVKPRYEAYVVKYDASSSVSDPVFNLPLWLQHSFKSDVFWAYNRTHLAAVKAYVQATLRERQTQSYMTMVERLPIFIKVAKNRDAILKLISQLEHKAIARY